ncbi:hypothetical protein Tco_0827965 [Tanacetum coccineum]
MGGVVISKPVSTTAGKSLDALKRLELQSGAHGNESRSVTHPTEEFVSSSVTPTPELDVLEDSGSTYDINVQARRLPDRYVVVTSSSKHSDVNADVSPKVKSPLPHVDVEVENAENVTAAFASGAGASSIPGSNVRTFASVPNDESPADEFYDSQTINSATAHNVYHVRMVFELRLWYEHEIMSRERFEKKFTDSFVVIQQRGAKIIVLKAKLEKAEREAAEVGKLCKRVSKLEVEVVARSEEFIGLNKRNVKLLAARRFEERAAGLDAHITEVKHDMDTDLYPYMLTAIVRRRWFIGHGIRLVVMKCAQSSECRSALGKFGGVTISLAINKGIQQGLEAKVEHGKAGRSLAQVEAYDPDVEKGDHSDADLSPEFLKLQPVSSQVTVPVYSEIGSSCGPGSVSGEILLSYVIATLRGHAEKRKVVVPSGVVASGSSQDNTLAIADYQISTLTLTDDAVPVTQPHDDFFKTIVLDKPADP